MTIITVIVYILLSVCGLYFVVDMASNFRKKPDGWEESFSHTTKIRHARMSWISWRDTYRAKIPDAAVWPMFKTWLVWFIGELKGPTWLKITLIGLAALLICLAATGAAAWLLLIIFVHFPLITLAVLVGAGILARWAFTPPHGGRALVHEIGNWPKIVHTGNGGYLITATIASPGRAKWPDWIALAAFFVIFFIALASAQTIWPVSRDNESIQIVGVMIGSAIVAWTSRAIWKPLCWTRLKIEVENGGASWTGPSGQSCRIQAGEAYEPIARPHHLAHEEARVFAANARKGRDEDDPAYQVSTEVIFKTGARKHIEWRVAEIMPDIGGTKAAALAAALDIAIERNRQTVKQAKAQQQAGAGQGERHDLDDE